MNKKDVFKAFFAGVFSIFPAFGSFTESSSAGIGSEIELPKNNPLPPVKVRLRPVIMDVGECFDDVGTKLRSAIAEAKR